MQALEDEKDDISSYDFIDFGCSKGGSIEFAKKSFGVERGVGIDIDPAKVATARAAGHNAMIADARKLEALPGAVSFVTMIDFLEHVPGIKDAETCIRSAVAVARDFIFIRQPWFDSDGYLFSEGFKLYWSDWRGHPNAMTSLEFHNILSRIPKIARFRIYGRTPIKTSEDTAVHPLASPADQHEWSDRNHNLKRGTVFVQPVFRQIMCIAELKGGNRRLTELEKRVPWHSILFDGRAVTTP